MAEAAIFAFFGRLDPQREIRAIGVGAPGIVEGGCVLRKEKHGDEFPQNGSWAIRSPSDTVCRWC